MKSYLLDLHAHWRTENLVRSADSLKSFGSFNHNDGLARIHFGQIRHLEIERRRIPEKEVDRCGFLVYGLDFSKTYGHILKFDVEVRRR